MKWPFLTLGSNELPKSPELVIGQQEDPSPDARPSRRPIKRSGLPNNAYHAYDDRGAMARGSHKLHFAHCAFHKACTIPDQAMPMASTTSLSISFVLYLPLLYLGSYIKMVRFTYILFFLF